MKKQGYNARLDESIGGRHKGPHKQSMKDRRDESKAMSKKMYGHAYGADKGMEYRDNFKDKDAHVVKGGHVSSALEHHFRK